MATYRQVLNRVLTALSEDEIDSGVSELTEKYHKLLGLFLNQVKEIVEDQHNWRALRDTENVTIAASTNSGTFTNANERSRIYRQYDDMGGEERALVFDITDSNNPYRLREIDLSDLLRRRTLDTSNGNDPVAFAMDMTSGTPTLQVWPTPTDERTIAVTLITPQGNLDNDALDTTIKVPSRAIEVGTIWYALEERGEELGVNGVFNQNMFEQILGSAVARDAGEQGDYNRVPA